MKQLYFLSLMIIALILPISIVICETKVPNNLIPHSLTSEFSKIEQLHRNNITNKLISYPANAKENRTNLKIPPKKFRALNLYENKIKIAEQERLRRHALETQSRYFYASALCMWKDQMRKILEKETECIETCAQRLSDRLEDDKNLVPGSEYFLRKIRRMLLNIRKFSNLVLSQKNQGMFGKILKEKRKLFWYILDMLTYHSSLIPQEFLNQAKKNVGRIKKIMRSDKTKGGKSSSPAEVKLKEKQGTFSSRYLQITKFFDKMGRLVLHDPKPEGRYEDCKARRKILKHVTLQMSAKLIGELLTRLCYLPEYPKKMY